MPLTDAQKQYVRNTVADLAARAHVEAPRIEFVPGNVAEVGRNTTGEARLLIGTEWLEIAENVARLCLCGHTHRDWRGKSPNCRWPGCDCIHFRLDRQTNVGIAERALRAVIAHEMGHLQQERDGVPTTGEAAEFDADRRGAMLVGVDAAVESLIYTDAWADVSELHASAPERVARLLDARAVLELPEFERP